MGEYIPPQNIQIFESPPEQLLRLLTSHLPASLTVLRRLQFAAYRKLTRPSALVIVSSENGRIDEDLSSPLEFAVAYVELLGGPDTQMYLYSSLENATRSTEHQLNEEHLKNIIDYLVQKRKQYPQKLVHGNSILLGSLHSAVRKILVKSQRLIELPSGDYDKWLFKAEDIPEPAVIPEGTHWGKASLEDCRLVASRTSIPRPPELLVSLEGLMLKLEDETPIAWAFLGLDGSIISIHCEDAYRRQGIAKMISAKLLREGNRDFAGSEWASADVSRENEGSRALCRSLNGTPEWVVSWVHLDLSESV